MAGPGEGVRMSRLVRAMALLGALVVALALVGCSGGGEQAAVESSSAGGSAKVEPSLDEFFDADSITGRFSVVRVDWDGKVTEMDGELWVDGRKFRYSLYQDGKLVRDITSPDGKTAYFVQHEGKYCEPSVASVDRYLLEFEKPSADAVEDGIDEKTGATRVVYTLKKRDDMKGSDNPWYTEDMTYLVKDGVVIGTIARGGVPDDDGKTPELDSSRRMFEKLTVGERIPAETFELPYPIKEAK